MVQSCRAGALPAPVYPQLATLRLPPSFIHLRAGFATNAFPFVIRRRISEAVAR